MKVVMINDCAFVGETLIKYLPADIDTAHLKRTRKFFDKTVKTAWRILRTKGDVYHCHYLLQDCWLALKLGKRPVVGHAHGSDLRSGIKHFAWSRIVRHNLKSCDKVLVSTPDILDVAKEFRKDADYSPNPVDTELFYPKSAEPHHGKLRVLVASDSDWEIKGTEIAIQALSRLDDQVEVSIISYGKDLVKTMALARSLGLHLNILPKVSHQNIREYYWKADVVIDRFKLGSLGLVSLEAIACGRPVINYVSSQYRSYRGWPLKDVNTPQQIVSVIENIPSGLWEREYNYLKRNHDPKLVIKRILKVYSSVV